MSHISEDDIHSNGTISRDCKLFVGNLSFFCQEKDLFSLFSPFGTVLKVDIARNPEMANNSLLYGYVEFDNSASADQAMMEIHGILFMGRQLRVVTLSSPQNTNLLEKPSELYSVHVNFVSHNTKEVVSEQFLHNLFSPFGAIFDIAIRRYFRQQRRQFGYAFVDFQSREAAYAAANALSQSNVNGIRIQATIGYRSQHNSQDKKRNADHTAVASGDSLATDSLESMHSTDGNSQYSNGQYVNPQYSAPQYSKEYSQAPCVPLYPPVPFMGNNNFCVVPFNPYYSGVYLPYPYFIPQLSQQFSH